MLMPFEWLDDFQQRMSKPKDYAQRTLAAYKLGMRANGSLVGVRIVTSADGCPACKALPSGEVYHPDDAPLIPLTDCDRQGDCTCVYRPVMTYELE